ncbi:MAG: RNA polymerase subunit sigma-24 [Acidobacteria bacterium]|nr:RNA polymerase subunit sigma-24 [Acidobacteriota bacterium]
MNSLPQLIERDRTRNPGQPDELFPLIYDQLRSLAGRYMSREREGHTLSPTALVNEVYLRLAGAELRAGDRVHFLAVAATVMRRILTDHARGRLRGKRGGGAVHVPLEICMVAGEQSGADAGAIHDAMETLAKQDARKCRVLELVCFGGLTYEEAGEVLSISAATVYREFRFAKAFLEKELMR